MIFCVLGMLLEVVFRTLGSSKMSVSCRRNTVFHKIDLPKSHSKNKSPQSSENIDFGIKFGSFFKAFLGPKSYQKSSKKKNEEKNGKKWSRGGLREIGPRVA